MNKFTPAICLGGGARVADLIFRLRKRAEIRRQIPSRKSVQEGAHDRIADLLEEAAFTIEALMKTIEDKHD